MQVRRFNIETDYSDVCSWWTKQDWPVLPKNTFSKNGFIAEENDQKLAATWVFSTGCPLYLMEWTVGNPDVNWESRAAAIKLVTDEACKWAKSDGATHIMTMVKNERFISKLEEYGFIKSDENMTHLIRSL